MANDFDNKAHIQVVRREGLKLRRAVVGDAYIGGYLPGCLSEI